MKRLVKALLAIMLTFTLVGCGGGSSSTAASEKVVNNFFDYLKEGNLDKLEKLGTKGYADGLGLEEVTESFEEFLDTDTYGKNFSTEAQNFIDVVFENFIKEHKVKEVKEDGDETVITVTGKRLDLEAISSDDIQDETMELMEDYQKENSEALQKILTEDGQEAAMKKVFDDISKDLFGLLSDKVEEADTIDFTLKFTLAKEKDEWLIDKITEKDSGTSKTDDPKKDEDPDEDLDLDDDTYKVDKAKLKASATLLQKGRLAEEDYLSEKRIKTDLEFIDYNAINGAGQEIDKYGFVDTSSGTLKFETEVHGNKGSKIVISIKDDRNQVSVDEYTLEDTKQVFTKELTGLDVAAKYFTVYIYTADSYDKEYDYGDTVGNYMISNER